MAFGEWELSILLRKRMQVKSSARESFHRSLDSILDIVLIIGVK